MKPADVIHVPTELPKNEATSCLHPFSRLPAIPITFWFNACSIVKPFSFSSTIMEERFSALGADFVFNLFPTLCTAPGMNLMSGTGKDTNPIDPTKAVQAQRSAASLPKFSAADFFFKIYLFIFGCAGSSLLCGGFSLWRAGAALWLRCVGLSLWWLLLRWSPGSGALAVAARGPSSCTFWSLAHRLSSCGAWA